MPVSPASVSDVATGLRATGYLPGASTALVSFLAEQLGKPISSRARRASARPSSPRRWRATSSAARAPAVLRGLDEAKALYEWNYRKQLLRIQAEATGTGWEDVQDDIFGEEFLLERPLMTAIASPEPVVLLIDEIDKTDQEFEALLLEVLSTSRSRSPSSAASRRARSPSCC
jgi:hypothetical protein